MAGSRYEYVKKFETGEDTCLLNTYMVVRIDGRGFHKFTSLHSFEKPNDEKALRLMNYCGIEVMKQFTDILLGYGQSDEYSFVFRRSSKLFNRRASKIVSCIVSLFASTYVMSWTKFMGDTVLQVPPQFDGRVVLYPTYKSVKDYVRWRQVDCHINNLFNTCFWNLVKTGLSNAEARARLTGTRSNEKQELLFSSFGINYNNEPLLFRKGSTLLWSEDAQPKSNVDEEASKSLVSSTESTELEKETSKPMRGRKRPRRKLEASHIDMIKESFWQDKRKLFEVDSYE